MKTFLASEDSFKVTISKKAKFMMDYIVDVVTSEVGWLGLTRKVGNTINIEDIYVLDQEVSAVTTEISTEAVSKLYKKLWDEKLLDIDKQDTDGLYFWGHSHVNMAVNPSGTDVEQFRVLCKENNPPYYIRLIQNKRGETNVLMYLNDVPLIGDLYIQDVKIEEDFSEFESLRDAIDNELKECLRKPDAAVKAKKIYNIGGAVNTPSTYYDDVWAGHTNGYGNRVCNCHNMSNSISSEYYKNLNKAAYSPKASFCEDLGIEENSEIIDSFDECAAFRKEYPGLMDDATKVKPVKNNKNNKKNKKSKLSLEEYEDNILDESDIDWELLDKTTKSTD